MTVTLKINSSNLKHVVLFVRANAGVKSINYFVHQSTLEKIPANFACHRLVHDAIAGSDTV